VKIIKNPLFWSGTKNQVSSNKGSEEPITEIRRDEINFDLMSIDAMKQVLHLNESATLQSKY
jgi:hypothetical protein